MSKQSEESDLEMYFLTKAPVEDLTRDQLRRRWAHLKDEREKLDIEIKTVGDVLIAGNPPFWIQRKIRDYLVKNILL